MQARLEGIKSIDLTKFLKHVNLYDNDLPDKFKNDTMYFRIYLENFIIIFKYTKYY